MGTVMDAKGSAIAGQRVEAIDTGSEQRKFSITNAAGVFYLEGLSQGHYRFEISGEPVSESPLGLDQSVEGSQEINFQVLSEKIQVQQIPIEIEQSSVLDNATLI